MPSLPELDCHAHVAPDITKRQLAGLDGALIFAVSRSLGESAWALQQASEPTLLRGLGVHPASRRALRQFDVRAFERLLPEFALIGEIGLDRRAGSLAQQQAVLDQILERVAQERLICSLHSAGCAAEVVETLGRHPVRAPVLHWFTGPRRLIADAIRLGCWFSVNAAMTDDQLAAIPPERTLPETDFPSGAGRRPGDVSELEARLGCLWQLETDQVRTALYANVSQLVAVSSVTGRLPSGFLRALAA